MCSRTGFQSRPSDISDWEDRKTKKVIIPAAMFRQMIHHGVSRNLKHISVIACMSAVGESLIPCGVASQNSSPVQEHLKGHGAGLGMALILKSNLKPYINTDIFLDHIRTVFLPCLVTIRHLAAFAEEVAMLLMDNRSAHVTDHVIHLLTEARVSVMPCHPIQLKSSRSLT
jgi:cytidine deaminase